MPDIRKSICSIQNEVLFTPDDGVSLFTLFQVKPCRAKFQNDEDENLRNDGDTRRIAKFIYPLHNNAKVFHFEVKLRDILSDKFIN